VELLKQHHLDGHPASDLNTTTNPPVFIMTPVLQFESAIEFVGDINSYKDCLMSQDETQDNPNALWFNIDIPKGHMLKAGDRVRITVEKL
jgi:hypothetical protein